MALNHAFVFDNTYPLPAASTVLAGEVFSAGSIIGVAQFPPTQGEIAGAAGLKTTAYLNGIHRFSLTGAVTVGAPIYAVTADLPGGTSTVQTSATSATFIGYAVEAKGTGAGQVWVLLQQGAPKA